MDRINHRNTNRNRSHYAATPSTIDALPLLARPVSGRVFSRRTLLGAAVSLGLTAFAGRRLSAAPATGSARTTSALNLRSRATTSSQVILVMPEGATVHLNGRMENGFQDVTYKGKVGWAHGDYLVLTGDAPPTSGTTAIVHSDLNLRSGPSTGHSVLRVMPGGAKVRLLGEESKGFHYINHDGLAGWAYGDWLLVNGAPLGHGDAPGGPLPNTRVTTTDLNLRAEPSMSGKVLLVMPEGATVTSQNTLTGNWLKVTYKGTTGWAWIEYLA